MKPNVILINCDDLGWGDLGCYGHPCHRTPFIDQLAAEGRRFTDFYMASPVCSPSRGAMLTGCYPKRIGFGEFEGQWVLFPGHPVGLDPEELTIGRLLRAAGYATRIVGKWHCGDQPEFLPTRHGFDGFYGLPYSNDMGRQSGRDDGAPPLPLMRDEAVIQQQPDQTSLTERYVEDCVQFIRANRDHPFFLYFAHMYVHLPLYVPARFLAESDNGPYGGAVAAIDWATGVILAELSHLGIDERTLVLFTSDNGSRNDFGGSNGPLRGTKGTTWEGGMRVPLIARWPGAVPQGTTSSALFPAIDLLPTIAALTGTALPANVDRPIDGTDGSRTLIESSAPPFREHIAHYHRDYLEAVRHGNWKLHICRSGREICELYDLEEDIGEHVNVAAQYPGVVKKLREVAASYREDLGDRATGQRGSCRSVGRVAEGRTLTEFDPHHPYYMAEYDLSEFG